MKRNAIITVTLLAIPFVVLDVGLFLAGKIQVEAAIVCIAVFAVIVGFYWLHKIKGEKVEKDERTLKLAWKAGSLSWQISFYVVCLLGGVDTLGLLHLTGQQYLVIVMMVMTFCYFIVTFIVNRKGDIG